MLRRRGIPVDPEILRRAVTRIGLTDGGLMAQMGTGTALMYNVKIAVRCQFMQMAIGENIVAKRWKTSLLTTKDDIRPHTK